MWWLAVGAFVVAGLPFACMWYEDREIERMERRLREDTGMVGEMEGED